MDKEYGFLGLLNKAGKLAFGEAIYRSRPRLLLIARSASNNSKKRLQDFAAFRKIPVLEEEGEKMGQALGRDFLSGLAILDEKAAKAYLQKKGKENL